MPTALLRDVSQLKKWCYRNSIVTHVCAVGIVCAAHILRLQNADDLFTVVNDDLFTVVNDDLDHLLFT